ncbi:hypothetical protein E2562_006201 [Oryza meyeriana var. granulata]|uniref:PSI-G n=1 Tax=Oryza meyeriana var. granulata TaxID=110450 RepID=A0A6G1CM62_9ORYZ|nr:hypothetical protein E2562_006201 [Oryza meyeriana var. granulata]
MRARLDRSGSGCHHHRENVAARRLAVAIVTAAGAYVVPLSMARRTWAVSNGLQASASVQSPAASARRFPAPHPAMQRSAAAVPPCVAAVAENVTVEAGLRLSPSLRARSVLFRAATPASRSVAARAELSPSLVIRLSTWVSLFLGRFVFFNFQCENMAKQVPEQNGKTHFDAGDEHAKEYSGLLKSNDPVGFNLVDVLAWAGVLGR